MNTSALLQSIYDSAVAVWMRSTAVAPVIEATHVVSAVLLFGTVMVVDLRLLGLADTAVPFSRVGRATLPLTWLAFGISVITGSLLFAASAPVFFGNTAFRLKVVALGAAGLNMAIFQLVTARHLGVWDASRHTPGAARVAGLVSILLWATVVLLGRWIGFTKGYDFTIPPGIDLGFPHAD